VIPSLRGWHNEYADDGLVVIGNHYPEFSYEEDLDNLKEALVRLDIPYAVAQDNDGTTWRAYKNRYWPTLYLIDKQGRIRYVHIGEGRYRKPRKTSRHCWLKHTNFPSLRGGSKTRSNLHPDFGDCFATFGARNDEW
jgi:hypothetical protein